MASDIESSPLKPWKVWRIGMDHATDALQRISALIRQGEDWSVIYAFDLGAEARWHANHCDGGFRAGIEMVLNAHGNKAAILGWQNAALQDDPSLNPIYKGE